MSSKTDSEVARERTTITVRRATVHRLRKLGSMHETYDEVINRVLEEIGEFTEGAGPDGKPLNA